VCEFDQKKTGAINLCNKVPVLKNKKKQKKTPSLWFYGSFQDVLVTTETA